jgi:hypothetical protein
MIIEQVWILLQSAAIGLAVWIVVSPLWSSLEQLRMIRWELHQMNERAKQDRL